VAPEANGLPRDCFVLGTCCALTHDHDTKRDRTMHLYFAGRGLFKAYPFQMKVGAG